MCCARLIENAGCKISPKIRHLGTIAQLCRAVSSQQRHVSTIAKENLLNSYISSTGPHNRANLDPLTAEIGSGVWGTQQISTGFISWLRYCSVVDHRKSTKLCTMFGHLLGCYIVYTLSGVVAPNGILPGAKFTLRHHAFSYIGSVTIRHSSSGRQPNFAAWYKEWNHGAFAEGATYIRLGGHHVGHRLTF